MRGSRNVLLNKIKKKKATLGKVSFNWFASTIVQ
jgi:hypothetical protein